MNQVIASFIDDQVKENPYLFSVFKLDSFNAGLKKLKNEYYSEKFSGFTDAFNSSEELQKQLIENPFFTLSQEGYHGSTEDIWEILEKNHLAVAQINREYLDQAMVDYCLEKEPRLLFIIPVDFQTTENVIKVIKKHPLLLDLVKDDLRSYKLCNLAFSLDMRVIKYIPQELVSDNILQELSGCKEYILDFIPSKYWNIDLINAQIALGGNQAINHLVEQYVLLSKYDELSDLFEVVLANKDYFNLKDVDPVIQLHPQFIAFVDYYSSKNPDVFSVLNINTVAKGTHDTMIRMGYIDSIDVNDIPDRLWKESYSAIYEVKSLLAFKYPKKYESIPSLNKSYWLNHWIELKKSGVTDLPYIPSYMVTQDAIEDADTFGEIYESRLSTQLMMDGNLSIESLSQINSENTSIVELKRLAENIESNVLSELQKQHVFWLGVKIPDASITKEEAIRFAIHHPYLLAQLPTTFIKDEDFQVSIKEQSPKTYSYLLKII